MYASVALDRVEHKQAVVLCGYNCSTAVRRGGGGRNADDQCATGRMLITMMTTATKYVSR